MEKPLDQILDSEFEMLFNLCNRINKKIKLKEGPRKLYFDMIQQISKQTETK